MKSSSNFSHPLWRTKKSPNLETWWSKLVQLRCEIKDKKLLLNLLLECSKREREKNNETMESEQQTGVMVTFLRTNEWKTKQNPDKPFSPQPAIFHSNLSLLSLIRVLLEAKGIESIFVTEHKSSCVKYAIKQAPSCNMWATPLN